MIERPPLGLSYSIVSPDGRRYGWSEEDMDAANVPSDVTFGDSMPGGFDRLTLTLPRKSEVDYPDLDAFSTIQAIGAGGEVAGECLLEKVPRTSGDKIAIGPEAVGWQAHLAHNQFVRQVYVDRDLSNWVPMSVSAKITLEASTSTFPHSVEPDVTSGQPELLTTIQTATSRAAASDAWYVAPSALTQVYYDFLPFANTSSGDANITVRIDGADDAGVTNVAAITGNLRAASGAAYVTLTKKAVRLLFFYGVLLSTDGLQVGWRWRKLAVYGTSLTKRGGTDPQGLFASDIINHAVTTFAPLLEIGEITTTSFVIPHASYTEPTSAADIIKDVNRVHLYDWAVWEGKRFYYHPRNYRGRKWVARVGPAKLESTGQDANRIWNSVVVQYQDVDGSTRTVGPPGSGATVESASLVDLDSENPATKLGITKRALLTSLGTSTSAVATEVGIRFLAETKQLDRSGKADLRGYVTDENGVDRPYWEVRAGDQIRFVDAADTSYRRIIRTSKSVSDSSVSIDLDAPAEGLDALLERLAVVLIPLGV
jgi:hypothetical protein